MVLTQKKNINLINESIIQTKREFDRKYNYSQMVNLFDHTIDLDKSYWVRNSNYNNDCEDISKSTLNGYGEDDTFSVLGCNLNWIGMHTNPDIKFEMKPGITYVFSIELKVFVKGDHRGSDPVYCGAWYVEDPCYFDIKNKPENRKYDIGTSVYNSWDYVNTGISDEKWTRFYFILNNDIHPTTTKFNSLRCECFTYRSGTTQVIDQDPNLQVWMRKPLLTYGEIFTDYSPNMKEIIRLGNDIG